MNAATSSKPGDYELQPVKFSRLTRRGVLFGLAASQLVVVGIGAVMLVFSLYVGGGASLIVAFPVILFCAALAFVGVGGRKLIQWLPIAAVWLWRSTGGQLIYRRRVVAPRPVGTLALPGDAARLRQWLDPETGAVMVHDPHRNTLTAIVSVAHPAFILLDPLEQERRVTGWGRVLATACRSGRIASLQIMERTLPDSGKGLAEWWRQHGSGDDSFAATTYGELIDRAGPAGERHASTISLSLDLKTASRAIRAAGGGNRGAAAVLRQEMSTIVAALRSADLSPSDWLEPGDLAVILRGAYDPDVGQRWSVTATSAETSPPPARLRLPKAGHRCDPTPRTTACCGSANGPGRWCSLGSSPPCCCRRGSAAPSACSTPRCAPTRPRATSGRRRPSTSPMPRNVNGSGRSKTRNTAPSTTTSCSRRRISLLGTGSSGSPG